MISLADARRGALEAIDRHVNTGATAEDVLRPSVELLVERLGYPSVSVSRPGLPEVTAGGQPHGQALRVPILHAGQQVGELAVGGAADDDREFVEHVARMLSSRCEG